MIGVECGFCGARFRVDERLAGCGTNCRKCKKPLDIPPPSKKANSLAHARSSPRIGEKLTPQPTIPDSGNLKTNLRDSRVPPSTKSEKQWLLAGGVATVAIAVGLAGAFMLGDSFRRVKDVRELANAKAQASDASEKTREALEKVKSLEASVQEAHRRSQLAEGHVTAKTAEIETLTKQLQLALASTAELPKKENDNSQESQKPKK